MDIRSIIDEGSGPAGPASGGRLPSRPPPQHLQIPPQQPGLHHPLPSTPVRNVAPPTFRDHAQAPQPSPINRSMPHDYHSPHGPSNFASTPPPPPPYGASPNVPIPYGGIPARPPPLSLQQLATKIDPHSPASSPMLMQSPYTRPPTGQAARADNVGYAFPTAGQHNPHPHPHPHQEASPVQSHRYSPHAPNAYTARDSYSQPAPGLGPTPSPGAMGHAPPPGYVSSHQVMGPQAPLVGTLGGPVANPYLTQQQHSRSTSVHSQPSYPSQQPFASPVTANHPPTPSEQHVRQHSQPPTPQAPPLSVTPRHSASTRNLVQPLPTSPYQQRHPSTGSPYPPTAYPPQPPPPPRPHQQGPLPHQSSYHQSLQHQQQPPHAASRPEPSSHPPLQRAPSDFDGAYEPQFPPNRSPAVDPHPHPHPHRASLSHSDRDRSVSASVSPRTRVPSIPSSIGHYSLASLSAPSGGQPSDIDPRDPRQLPFNPAPMKDAPAPINNTAPPPSGPIPRADRPSTPAKRKMDDRELQSEDMDLQEPRPPPFPANGAQSRLEHSSRSAAAAAAAVRVPARRKARQVTAPIWAQPYNKQDLRHPNHYLRKAGANHARTNGLTDAANVRQERPVSRHVSPDAPRRVSANQTPPFPPINPNMATMLGPWEQTFANKKPLDAVVRAVADFLYVNVVSPSELKELASFPGIEFEIEAKLGCLVDRNLRNNARRDFGLATEAVVRDDCTFHSSMTEVQHKRFNEYLNCLVADTSPQNPKNKNAPEPRVPINYVHIKEIDKFYEVPAAFQASLPPILQNMLRDPGRPNPTLRVTTDKNGKVVAKILKIKVRDLHIHFPTDDLDCRISVNMEVAFDGPMDGLEALRDRPDRHKDRLSYSQGLYRADLTQVIQPEAGQPNNKKMHELEIEMNARAVAEHGRRAAESAPHNYDFLVQGFVDNIRLLTRMTQEMRQ